MEKIYNPKNIEESIYKCWEHEDYFSPHGDTSQGSYCIMMPPPNITGQLHLGHAFQQTIMDVLIRYQRMQGKNTLWQTGTDHAGIATQMLVEHKIYNNTGKNRHDYTRDELIKKIWEWKNQSERFITYQMKRLGNSVDWKRKRFTMDTEMSYAVTEAFVRLYQNNFIYRGTRLVNWDYKLQTAISDLEVTNKKTKGFMWYINYKFDNSTIINSNSNHLVVATTRPETILGDTAIAVHPEDTRYKNLIGKYVITPITNRRIPIIFDKHVDMLKGTGCVKITPAHDFNDYVIGKRHALPMIKIFSLDGKILTQPEVFNSYGQLNEQLHCNIPQIFHNLDGYKARKKIISECNALKLLHKIEPHDITIPYSDRTDTIIEPMLTNQWYIRIKNLSQHAINAVNLDMINFIPKQYKNMYFSWMHNLQDWCISRQIWWGHKIPAWYDDNNKIYVGHCEQDIRTQNKLDNDVILHRDEDVLDTWFSSSLWTFAALGWPKNTNLLNVFHPTNIIISGFDIIFFWIARMIMLTMHFIKNDNGSAQIPFKTVYITGLIRDEFGQKMSKSKGNIIDPIDIIDGISIENLLKKRTKNMLQPQLSNQIIKYTKKQFPNGIKPYGTDALRFTLVALASSGRDIHWDMKRLTGYRNFCNKLWHVSRFILMHTKNQDCGISAKEKSFSLADRWITTKFYQTIQIFHKKLEIYRFDKIANILHEFIWHQFCDWYIELTKPILYHGNTLELRGTRYTLITLLESLLRLAHPIIPFITEKIWQEVKIISGNNGKTIMLQSFPEYNESMIDTKSVVDLEWMKHTIIAIRTTRVNMNIAYNIPLQIVFRNTSSEIKRRITENSNILCHIAQLRSINFIPKDTVYPKSVIIPLDSSELLIQIPETFNKEIEINRLKKESKSINHKIEAIQKLLDDNNFMKKAPNSVIQNKQKLLNYYEQIQNKLIDQCDIIKKL
ncbi:valine--tRNA ligase [Blochmannia endosymbiont of Camponotus sp. C-003]|uniref:valine--tRNA ligase n=1 Tax=unclassified Candidatus Blochmanniella TaxID=711328 RepID=UPI0020249900|nr:MULTISPECIES: valine--tRNA ligase [unclassified Candidatus Blochmannia]URJ23194.1 valine--tRNA ligase [Blochmannia endosymbiont of Camponotus sp. C-003]URJ28663.1 valine--tRNA ligase [Blochmannia endosymbiont of Camponotus sp. C-046]